MRPLSFCVLLVVASGMMSGQDGPAITVSPQLDVHAISPDIYGVNDFDEGGLSTQLRLSLRRWGGNQATRYSWKLDTYNAASDYYFTNYAMRSDNANTLPDSSKANEIVDVSRRTASRTMMTVPTIGWLPKTRDQICGFSIRKYGKQQKVNPYNADCGNGLDVNGKDLTGNDPKDASMPVDANFTREWMQYLLKRFGPAESGGVQIYALDNEPTIWMWTHRDVHPAWVGYEEILKTGIAHAEAIMQADPTAQIAGPVLHGPAAYDYSALDWQRGWSTGPNYKYWGNPVDRKAHGDVPFTQWYLQQMRAYEQRTGTRILHYLDIHAYVLPDGLSFGSAGDAANQRLRLESTRTLWDPDYKDLVIEDSGQPYRLIPRMKEWVRNNYPGTKLAITEYNWGALDNINGALAQAEVLGIFGREGLDAATIWGPPKPTDPGAFSFRIFRNYDGLGSSFGDASVRATTDDRAKVSVYAATRSIDSALTVLLLNKTADTVTVPVNVSGYAAGKTAGIWQYSPKDLTRITKGNDLPVSDAGQLRVTLPPQSMTMAVVPRSADGLPPTPVINAVRNAASYAGNIAPGTIGVIFGEHLGPDALTYPQVSKGLLPTSLAGVQVLFDGTPAPLIYVSKNQLAFIVPYVADLARLAHVQVSNSGAASDVAEIPVGAAAPALFTIDSSGKGQAAVLNQDGIANGPNAAAPAGSVLQIFATGEGQTDPYGVDGRLASTILPKPRLAVKVELGGIMLTPEYAGAAPGAASGLLQVNVRIPGSFAPNAKATLRVWVGEQVSQDGVTVATK